MGAKARVSSYDFHLLGFIHADGSNLRLYDGSDLKTYLWMGGLGPDVLL